jgi:hypothetical protein
LERGGYAVPDAGDAEEPWNIGRTRSPDDSGDNGRSPALIGL